MLFELANKNSVKKIKKCLIAGGGTGGHLFSGIAITQSLKRKKIVTDVLFVVANKNIEITQIAKYGFNFKIIAITGIKNLSLMGIIKTFFRIPGAIIEAIKILYNFEPDLVIGVGGYVSGPVLVAAWLLQIETLICEQNSLPGFTSKVVGNNFAKKVFGAFDCCKKYFPINKFILSGNPVRFEFFNFNINLNFHLINNKFTILVLGGSLGSDLLNNITPEALIKMRKRQQLQVVHQTGKKVLNQIQSTYNEIGVRANVVEFINDMPSAYFWADLVISRSGAIACSELAITATPSILVPFPGAADDHQVGNAEELVFLKTAVLINEAIITSVLLAGFINLLVFDIKTSLSFCFAAKNSPKYNAADFVCSKFAAICQE